MKTRFLVTGFILLVFLGSLLFGQGPPGLILRQWVMHPTLILLRINTFFLNDLLQFSRTRSLVEENRFLTRKLTKLQEELSFLQGAMRRSERRDAFLAFQKSHPKAKGLFCHIIGRDPSHWSQTIFLDRGRLDGVELDMAVLGTKGLVGRIVSVEDHWSKALLMTDAGSKVGAILKRSREAGLLVGTSRGLLTLEYLSPGADVREGDKVLTAGFGEIFPKGILIGEVVGFGRREETLLQYALVKPVELLSQLEEVLCLKR
ncbi:MAG: rod shape-determining protein MreC [Gemmatimonadetes bacterium]|nr:rod shape-determining protein MreC [Gemmatimonadota bacterium]